MKLTKYNKINEEIKTFISDFQLNQKFEKEEFIKLHKELLKTIEKEKLYEDCKIGLINSYNQIMQENLEFLTSEYHLNLWKLHQRIIKNKEKKEKLKIRQLPKEMQKFNKILSNKKLFFKEDNVYFIVSLIGNAKGHFITIKVSDKIELEYNNHSPSRTALLKERLEKKGYKCSGIKVLKNIFPAKETADNLFFTAEKIKIDGDLEFIGKELALGIDCDWILLDAGKEYTEEEMQNELLLIKTAFMLYDLLGIEPKDFLNIIKSILRIS